MKFLPIDPPREFKVGAHQQVTLKDCARVELAPDEQVTFTTEAGGEYDIVRKDWGFYATPSLNGRLARFGFRSVLIRNKIDQLFLLLVERGHEAEFEAYHQSEGFRILCWLDGSEPLDSVEASLTEAADVRSE